jgi:hypothetical protein
MIRKSGDRFSEKNMLKQKMDSHRRRFFVIALVEERLHPEVYFA